MLRNVKVFVSWSRSASKSVAEAFADWLPRVIQECEPFISSDTEKGDAWFDTIEKNLAEARVGVLFLTPQNKNAAWLNYEAGALRTLRNGNMKRLCAVFVGMKPADYDGPIKNFQMTNFSDKSDMFKLLQAINGAADRSLSDRRLEEEFEEKWDRLAADADAAVREAAAGVREAESVPERTRSSDDKLDEVLDLLREIRFSSAEVRTPSSAPASNSERAGKIMPQLRGMYLMDKEEGYNREVLEALRFGDNVIMTLDDGSTVEGALNSFSFSNAPF
jgi:hypothetical protein